MPKTPPTAGQTIYRLSVMVGTLSIGSMAAYLYGPPPEKLAGLINTAANSLTQMAEQRGLEHRDSAPQATGSFDFATKSSVLPTAPVFAASGVEAIDAASAITSNIPQNVTQKQFTTNNPSELLREAGAIDSAVTPWGSTNASTGQSLYRAAATVPVGGAAGGNGLVEQLDAIGETPQAAVDALLAQMNQIRR